MYGTLRAIRKDLRNTQAEVTAIKLTAGLGRYSERGVDYINDLVSLIKFNKLDEKFPLLITDYVEF